MRCATQRLRRWKQTSTTFVVVALVFATLNISSSADAEQVLDQQQTTFNESDSSLVLLFAQTFTARVNGPLTRVDLLLRAEASEDCDVVIRIRETSSGEPTGPVLASATLNASQLPPSLNFVPVTFAFPPTVTDGTLYGITMEPLCFEPVEWAFSSFSAYAFGEGFTKIGPTGRLLPDGRDYAFKTFVLLPSPVLVSPANGSTTSDATPLFSGIADTSGTADLTEVTIEIFQGASTSGPLFLALVADPNDVNGAFGVSPDVALPNGTYVAQILQDNSFGEFGRSNANVFAVDSAATTPPSGSAPPSGGAAPSGDAPSGDAGQAGPPETTITSPLVTRTKDRTPTFAFASNESGVRFECSIDGSDLFACASPFTVADLDRGKDHSFVVRAIDADGNIDPSPARADFKVSKKTQHHRRR